jgi:4-aminobutyrate aminotransferase-like enzyme
VGRAADGRLIRTGLNFGELSAFGEIVGGDGASFTLRDGRRLLDASNTAAPLGHAHPDVVRAVADAAAAPIVNEGWAWPEREEAARELINITFADDLEWVGAVRFCLSGSEANDLALSLSQAITGRTALATRERAYHGMVGLARDMTVQPHWHGGVSSRLGAVHPVPRTVVVKELPHPGGARIGDAQSLPPVLPSADDLKEALHDVAAVVIDYSQGGAYHTPGFQDAVAEAAHVSGALWIADEVVTGFGRTGGWYAFQKGSSNPDIVTLGKPIAGGLPGGAVVLSRRLTEALKDGSWQTYSTFRGYPVMIAAMRATLGALDREGLVWRAAEADSFMYKRLSDMASTHPSVERIDGRGLHWTIELYGPHWRSWHANLDAEPVASRVALKAAQLGVLIGTSGEQCSLFLAPPLIIEDDELASILDALDEALIIADEEFVEKGSKEEGNVEDHVS